MSKEPILTPTAWVSTSIQPAHILSKKKITKPNASNLRPEPFHMLECESIICNNLLNLHFLWLQE